MNSRLPTQLLPNFARVALAGRAAIFGNCEIPGRANGFRADNRPGAECECGTDSRFLCTPAVAFRVTAQFTRTSLSGDILWSDRIDTSRRRHHRPSGYYRAANSRGFAARAESRRTGWNSEKPSTPKTQQLTNNTCAGRDLFARFIFRTIAPEDLR